MKKFTDLLCFILIGLILGSGSRALGSVKSIAHRGGSLFAPENTCASFSITSNSADLVEFDVRVSLDGELVVMHDDTIDRTTDGTGLVNTLTLAQLKALDAGSWFSPFFSGETIPTLAEAIQCILPAATPLIEQKTGSAQAYVDLLQAMNVTSNVVLQSFGWDFLRDINDLDPTIRLAALGSGVLSTNVLTDIQSRGIGTVAWSKNDITATEIERVHAFGMELFVWTANGSAVQDAVDLGVDGVISDDPALVRELSRIDPVDNQILAKGLVSYWKLDDGVADNSATTVVDVEVANPGALQGSSWVVGSGAQLGGALALDGITDYVDIPQSEGLDIGTNEVSISLWVNMPTNPTEIAEINAIYDSTGDSYVVYLDKASGELRFKVTDAAGGAERPGIPGLNIETGRWHHVVGVFNGAAGPVTGQVSIYLDGRLEDLHTRQNMTEEVKAGQHAALGRNGTAAGYWFAGEIDDIAIWRRALSSAEVAHIFNSGTNGIPLQKNVMNLQVTGLDHSPDSLNLQFDVQVSHALLAVDDLILMGSTNIAGPYTNEDTAVVQDMGNNEYIFFWPMDSSTSKFFKVINP